MEPVFYYYEAYDNQLLPESEQGFAAMTLVSAAETGKITEHLIAESLRSSKKIKLDYMKKSLDLNRKHCPTVFNVKDPLTGEVYEEMPIDKVFNMPQLKELYEELSNAVGDLNQLKEGIKKK